MRHTADTEPYDYRVHDWRALAPIPLFCGVYPEPWHPSRWDWSATDMSLGICQRYAKLTPAQKRIHDVEALSAPPALRRLMPAATKALHADPQFVATAQALTDYLSVQGSRHSQGSLSPPCLPAAADHIEEP